MVTRPPKIYTRLFHTIPPVASLQWSFTHMPKKTVNTDTIVLFAMCMETVLLQVAGLICVYIWRRISAADV